MLDDHAGEVIVDMEDRSVLIYELKEKILSKIECFDNQRQIFQEIFSEIDVDGSNSINKFEFREFLRLLELKYRFVKFLRVIFVLFDRAMCYTVLFVVMRDLPGSSEHWTGTDRIPYHSMIWQLCCLMMTTTTNMDRLFVVWDGSVAQKQKSQ
jgi:hypothetical protein